MLAGLDIGDGLADVEAVLDDGVALPDVPRGDLVSDGDVIERLDLDGGIILHHPAGKLLAGLDAFDHGDTYGVLLVMNQNMDHFDSCEQPVQRATGMDWKNRVVLL